MEVDGTTERGRARGPSPCAPPARRAAARHGGTSRRWRTLGALAVIAGFAPLLLLLLAGSLREPGLPPPAGVELVPDPASTEGYRRALDLGGLLRAALNSTLVAAIAVPASVLIASLAGFALTQLPRRVAAMVLGLSLIALMAPATALLAPRFAIFRMLDLTDTLAPLIAPALVATSPLYPLVYYVAFRALPADLYDACRLADLSPLQVWWRFAMPLVRPVTAGLAALTFVLTWSNFLDPLVYVYDRDLFTLPLALRSLATLDRTDFPVFLAGAVLATLPALLVFGIAQRRFLQHYGTIRGGRPAGRDRREETAR